jgi:hypothetical protein
MMCIIQILKSAQLLSYSQGLIYHPSPQKKRFDKSTPYDWTTRAAVLIFDELLLKGSCGRTPKSVSSELGCFPEVLF